MRDIIYLRVSKKGVEKEAWANEPALRPGQKALKINISLPNSIFENPQLEARLDIKEEEISDTSIRQLEFELRKLKES